MFRISIKFLIFLLILFVFIISPLFSVRASDVWCWNLSDCDNLTCEEDGPSTFCPDVIPGCSPFCKDIEAYCPLDSACKTLMGISVYECSYFALVPDCNISADPSTIIQGQSSTIFWSSDGT